MTSPTNQNAEVLNLLLTEKTTTSLNLVMNGILNPTARISSLRAKGVNIICRFINHTNKFGRSIRYGEFSVLNKKDSKRIYKEIN
jgi:hypothetical protein